MSDDYQRIELITGAVRRRHWTTEQKLQIIEESFQPGETVSSVARRRGVAPNLLYRWRRLMTEGGAAAVGSDEPVVGSSEVRRLEERVLGRPMPPANRAGDQFDTLVVVRHKPVLEDSLKPCRLCRVSGRNGGQSILQPVPELILQTHTCLMVCEQDRMLDDTGFHG